MKEEAARRHREVDFVISWGKGACGPQAMKFGAALCRYSCEPVTYDLTTRAALVNFSGSRLDRTHDADDSDGF